MTSKCSRPGAPRICLRRLWIGRTLWRPWTRTNPPKSAARIKNCRFRHDNTANAAYIDGMVDLIAPASLANFLLVSCRQSGEVLTNLKLQKLMYYSQAWHLALQGEPLFDEDFQAWVHGPVLPSQYQRFRDFQWRPIDIDLGAPEVVGPGLAEFLPKIVDIFGSETAVALELMTHREPPWVDARGNLPSTAPSSNVIPKRAMRDYYRALGEDKAE